MKLNIYVKCLLLLIIGVVATPDAGAVFKERDFGRTIEVLCAELELKYKEQQETMRMYEANAKKQHEQLVATMQQIDQISLILYSQSSQFTFDMAYACQQATDLYDNSRVAHMPFDKILARLDSEVERYDSLIYVLKHISPAISGEEVSRIEEVADSIMMAQQDSIMRVLALDSLNDTSLMVITVPPAPVEPPQDETLDKTSLYVLNEREIAVRAKCLFYATALRDNTISIREKMSLDKEFYDEVTAKLISINNYALKQYEQLQNSIFRNGGSNYFKVLGSLGQGYRRLGTEMKDKYGELYRDGELGVVKSQWRGPIIYMTSVFILFYIFVASVVSLVILRWCLPRKIRAKKSYIDRRNIIGLTCGVFLFMLFISIATSVSEHNFFVMAINTTVDYAWLLLVILLSLLIRLDTKQLHSGVMAYTPFMLMAFVVILMRIVFIPNSTVNIIFPPLLLLFTIWQLIVIRKRREVLPLTDIVLSLLSLFVLLVSTVLSWVGYTLLAVQILMWWTIQLAYIQTIICLYDLAQMYANKVMFKRIQREEFSASKSKKHANANVSIDKIIEQSKHGEHIAYTWFYDAFVKVVLPVLGVLSFLTSIVFAANLFDMKQVLFKVFYKNFVDQDGLIQISLYKIVLVSSLFFVFYYINYVIHALYRKFKLRHLAKTDANQRPNITLANNIITIIVWGSFFIFALVLFKVPKSGISLITAGLATGLGFAMKDILENFIYGLSLMSGRVRVGDYIECDGILGKVESIGYQSTQIVTLDGSIIAFLNTSLFNKNFKNMTRNHSYEYVKLTVGVAYGVKIEEVRTLLVTELNKFTELTGASGRPVLQKKQGFKVLFGDFGDSSVNLIVAFWVLVEEKISFVCQVKETIYNTLQANGIEIPFPQQDVYVRQLPSAK